MKIIAAVDQSQASIDAAHRAAELAAKLKDDLLLVRAVEPVATYYPESVLLGLPGLEDEILRACTAELESLRKTLGREGLQIETVIERGPPAEVLVGNARKNEARLLVMGHRPRPRGKRLLVGSATRKILRESPCPVLVLAEGSAPFEAWAAGRRPLHLVVGVDLGQATETAMAWIGQLCQAGPCDLHLVHEYWPPAEYARLGIRSPRDPETDDPQVVSILKSELRARIKPPPAAQSVSWSIHPAWDGVGSQLGVDAAAEHADILVVGFHQGRGLDAFIHNSVPSSAWRSVNVPLLCVPLRAAAASRQEVLPSVPTLNAVLVATDLSPLGNSTVPHAYAMLRGHGGRVELLYVQERSMPEPTAMPPLAPEGLTADDRRALEEKLAHLVPPGASELGIITNLHVVDGGIAPDQILKASRRLGVDAIVIASHGRRGVHRALMGSVAEAVLRGSDRPVTIIKDA